MSTSRTFTPRYFDETLDSHDADSLVFRDKAKNKYLEAATKPDDLHKTLPRQQADQLANQITTFEVHVVSSHVVIQENLRGISTELSAPPSTKQAN